MHEAFHLKAHTLITEQGEMIRLNANWVLLPTVSLFCYRCMKREVLWWAQPLKSKHLVH
jgi:hypothetical protein